MADIIWSFTVGIGDELQISSTQSLSVQAYDKIEVVVAGAASGSPTVVAVDVQPSAATQVKFLLINSDRYGADLTYTVTDTGGVADVVLDSPQLIVGAGAMSLLGADPKTIEFSNGLGVGNDATITILVGRDV
jgi:hypothetical protein